MSKYVRVYAVNNIHKHFLVFFFSEFIACVCSEDDKADKSESTKHQNQDLSTSISKRPTEEEHNKSDTDPTTSQA